MPWLETEPMNEKVKFISAYLMKGESSFRGLCKRFSISCKTGYKYVKRYKAEGIDGLKEHSRAPLVQANTMPSHIEQSILEVKYRYPSWGAKKIKHWLQQEKSDCVWPAKSTIEDLLKRNGLVTRVKRKKRVAPYTQPFILCGEPNDTWSIDYKGQFLLGNRQLCYPLTVTDNFSRYLLSVEGSERILGIKVKKILTQLFLEYGLPRAIRSDNGIPFASHAIAGLSELSVWLIKLGIIPERIRKGHPEENGRHERMHLTLKKETALPPKSNLIQQQQSFDLFKKIFNEQRPHEGINFNRPAWIYTPSSRAFPSKLPPTEYSRSFYKTRRIRTNGTMKWRGKEIFISETLRGETIAFTPFSETQWLIYFSFMPLAFFDEKSLKITKLC